MQITLITIGTLKESYIKEAFEDYKKRISAYAQFKEINLQEARILDEDNPGRIQSALLEEAEKIRKVIPQDAYKIALCIEGKQYTSEELASLISSVKDKPGKVVFLIGSSYGLDASIKSMCDLKLSFSKLTFPHQLMRVILMESIYRSCTIIAGKKYHK